MTDSLAVAVNRDGLHTLAVPTEFEASGPFAVRVHNHGEAAHVHLNLDDRLSEIARIGATNHYVEAGESRSITVETREPSRWPSDTIRGKLKVVVGHGQETHYVDVTVDRTAANGTVRVDPELGKPNRDSEPELPPLAKLVPVVALGSVALVLAVGAVFTGGGIDVVIGGLSIVAAACCAAAAYYLLG
ncbi:DUF7524 family protein [Natronomonas salsuginis]|uniref:Uncharacterized protein n=1 Tax=Natronomonas salsuginis TaxID=2217661 RepID=A0A4U5JPL6_9EURY|nr:hypothetical protein [Natronomonas salsuginis]TKR28159.1 hypothetical protein DM868_03510 [Natronomonas salsuginis]